MCKISFTQVWHKTKILQNLFWGTLPSVLDFMLNFEANTCCVHFGENCLNLKGKVLCELIFTLSCTEICSPSKYSLQRV